MILLREHVINDAVLGGLYVGGVRLCETLENKGKLIPCGHHSLSVSMSPKFKRDLALIHSDAIPSSRGIRLHAGNRADQSLGCVLVGMIRDNDRLVDSKTAETIVTALAKQDSELIIANIVQAITT